MQDKLNKLLNKSYSPYSNVQVASILITKDGKEISGVNVENAAYPSGICAERNAIFHAATLGYTSGAFKEIHLTSNLEKHLYPCAGCRQVMAEFFDADTKVIVWYNGEPREHDFKDILPFSVDKGSF